MRTLVAKGRKKKKIKKIMLNPTLLNLRVPSKHRDNSSLEATKNIKLDRQVSKKGKSHQLLTHLLHNQNVT